MRLDIGFHDVDDGSVGARCGRSSRSYEVVLERQKIRTISARSSSAMAMGE